MLCSLDLRLCHLGGSHLRHGGGRSPAISASSCSPGPERQQRQAQSFTQPLQEDRHSSVSVPLTSDLAYKAGRNLSVPEISSCRVTFHIASSFRGASRLYFLAFQVRAASAVLCACEAGALPDKAAPPLCPATAANLLRSAAPVREHYKRFALRHGIHADIPSWRRLYSPLLLSCSLFHILPFNGTGFPVPSALVLRQPSKRSRLQ